MPQTLVHALIDLEAEYKKAKSDPAFARGFEYYMREFVGRIFGTCYESGIS